MTQAPTTPADEPDRTEQPIERWDGEGGSPDPDGEDLPSGITSRLVREYMVGSYRYTDLAQALAERERQIERDRK